jgi:hypothetical protein
MDDLPDHPVAAGEWWASLPGMTSTSAAKKIAIYHWGNRHGKGPTIPEDSTAGGDSRGDCDVQLPVRDSKVEEKHAAKWAQHLGPHLHPGEDSILLSKTTSLRPVIDAMESTLRLPGQAAGRAGRLAHRTTGRPGLSASLQLTVESRLLETR